jgi:hypothetical protein
MYNCEDYFCRGVKKVATKFTKNLSLLEHKFTNFEFDFLNDVNNISVCIFSLGVFPSTLGTINKVKCSKDFPVKMSNKNPEKSFKSIVKLAEY